jgi:hypothetical protein
MTKDSSVASFSPKGKDVNIARREDPASIAEEASTVLLAPFYTALSHSFSHSQFE